MKKVVITGANGYLASLIQQVQQEKLTFIPITRKEIDFTKPETISTYFKDLFFDAMIHCAARTQTLDCEQNPDETYLVNTKSAIELAKICEEKGARFLFLSTEQVFNQKDSGAPYKESDETSCISVYGQQKIEVEHFLTQSTVDFITLRLSWMFGLDFPGIHASPNIIKKTLDALFFQKPTAFTVNEYRGITYAKSLADQFDKLLTLPKGIYHFSSTNTLNTYESAKRIGKRLGFSDKQISAFILPDFERYQKQPRNYCLDTTKIQNAGINCPTFDEDIEACLSDFGWL